MTKKNMLYEFRQGKRFPHVLICPVFLGETGDYYSVHYLMDYKGFVFHGKHKIDPTALDWITDYIGHHMMDWHVLFGNEVFEIRFLNKDKAKAFYRSWNPYTFVHFGRRPYEEVREIESWLQDNIKNHYKLRDTCVIFSNQDDAAFFKLSW